MWNLLTTIVRLVALLLLPIACKGPSIVYQEADDSVPPPSDAITFYLRTSNIILTTETPFVSQVPSQAKPLFPAAISSPSASREPTTADAAYPHDTCPDAVGEDWAKCFKTARAAATATNSSHGYFMVPNDGWIHFGTTEVTASTVDSDDTMIKTITINFQDNRKRIITDTGTGAITGLGFGGPYGAAIGAVLGFVGAAVAKEGLPADVSNKICKSDLAAIKQGRRRQPTYPVNPALFLPVVIGSEVLQNMESNREGCWHVLPNNRDLGSFSIVDHRLRPRNESPGDGWFYRVVIGNKAAHSMTRDNYFNSPPNESKARRHHGPRASESKDSFPYSSCRSAEIQLTWWKELDKKEPQQLIYASYSMKVADPDNVGVAYLPWAGNIHLLSVCGANISTTRVTLSSAKDLIDEMVKQVKDFKDAQDKSNLPSAR